MNNKNRDDFTPNDKRIMAERVSWKCSYPGCGRNTVGPNSNDPTKKINNGIAAHIHAAAAGGPRYNPNMSSHERRNISNGIWMCRDHGNLIDADYTEYSATTLHEWKNQAERRAAESLKLPSNELRDRDTTLIQLGSDIIYKASWEAIHAKEWSFQLITPVIGSDDTLNEYILNFDSQADVDSYIVIESQGDARKIIDIKRELSPDNKETLFVKVDLKPIATDPNKLGSSMKIDETGDLLIINGAFERVKGIDNAKQIISTSMSVIKGEISSAKDLGSLATYYYDHYRNDLKFLSKLILLELVRLSLIPTIYYGSEQKPSLHFVKRILNVNIVSSELTHSRLTAYIELEWGNGEMWSGNVPIFVLQT